MSEEREQYRVGDDAGSGLDIVWLRRGVERYVFVFRAETSAAMRQLVAKMANDDDLSFTWFDAAVVLKKMQDTQ